MTPLLKSQVTECLVCSKTLGAESRDLGMILCHDHRLCTTCTEPLLARELQWCLNRYHEGLEQNEVAQYTHMDIIHPRCEVTRHKATMGPSEYDYLNLIRLLAQSIVPDMNLNQVSNENIAMNTTARLVTDMDFEQMSLHLRMLQACESQVRIAIMSHPQYRKEAMLERDKHLARADKLKAKDKINGTSTSQDTTDITSDQSGTKTGISTKRFNEVELAKFMEKHGFEVVERDAAEKIFKQRNKSIDLMLKLGANEDLVRSQIDADLLKKGLLRK